MRGREEAVLSAGDDGRSGGGDDAALLGWNDDHDFAS